MRVFKKRIAFSVMLIVVLLSIGTVYYQLAEGWSPVDSFYFSTMTLTTIGFGDLTPTTEGAKIFTSMYAIFGIGIMLYILSSVIGVLVFRQESRFNRAFSFIGRLGRQQKRIKELEKKITVQSKKEIIEMKKELEKARKEELEELQKDMKKEEEKDIRKIEKRIKRIKKRGSSK